MSYQPNPWLSPRTTARQRSTRWLLLSGIVLAVALAAITVLTPSGGRESIGLFTPAWILIVLGAKRSPFTLNAYLVRRGFENFDEFERAAVYEAIRRSYLIIVASLFVAIVWLFGAVEFGLPLPTRPIAWQAIGAALFWIVTALPVTIAEFTVPMPVPDDDV